VQQVFTSLCQMRTSEKLCEVLDNRTPSSHENIVEFILSGCCGAQNYKRQVGKFVDDGSTVK